MGRAFEYKVLSRIFGHEIEITEAVFIYLFIHSLNDAVTITDYIQPNGRMSNEL
jgi:hypothetical protein